MRAYFTNPLDGLFACVVSLKTFLEILMRKIFIFLVLSVVAVANLSPLSAFAKGREKVKVSELLKDANDIMSEAQEVYVDGDSDKAVTLYKKALVEIKKIERRYPDQVTSSDFAPLRFRRALCETEIDRILLEQVNVSSRTVAVTDTRELEKKRAERKANAKTNRLAKVSKKLTSKTNSGVVKTSPSDSSKPKDEKKPEAKAAVVEKNIDVNVELDWADDMLDAGKFAEAEKSLIKVLRVAPDNFKARYMMALVRIRGNQFQDAQIIIEDLLEDYGRNEGVLLLASGMYMAMEQYSKAMSTLDKALKLAPDRPDAYLNMAWLLLEMNPRELNDPEMYYRRSVKLGGPRDHELEKRLGIKQK